MKANQAGMLEVEASKRATDRATRAEVKQFADMMVKDHGKAGEALKQLATSRGLTLPDKLDAAHQAKLDKLSRAQKADFDKLYSQTVGTPAPKESVSLFDKTSKGAKDAEVKSFAAKTLPTLKEHLAHAQQLDRTVATPGTTPAGASTSSNTGVTSSGTAAAAKRSGS
jgi:putative membrane protein